jgi:alanyl-tRNA synthetase
MNENIVEYLIEQFPATERLYFLDSHLLHFAARVLACRPQDNQWIVLLDRTAFYPTGGGQPHDQGTLGEARVIDCIENEDRILHIVDRPIDGAVNGLIDPIRRRDHLQQHTGQHILSQAFIKIAGAETRGFHLGVESSTIDIELENPAPELISQAEQLANAIVFEDRPVHIHLAGAQDLARFPLRKETEREGCVRIIEIEGFDYSPCGGTHAQRAGEVGIIAVRAVERVKRMSRIEFLCGARALKDYHAAHASAMATAALFSATRDAAPELVARLQQEQKQSQKRMRELLELALESEARHLYEAAKSNSAGTKIVLGHFSNRALEEVKMLSHLIVAQGAAVALLVVKDESPRLVFARSKGLAEDCGKMLGALCQQLGGRGGGKADFAQGGLPANAAYEVAMLELATTLLAG